MLTKYSNILLSIHPSLDAVRVELHPNGSITTIALDDLNTSSLQFSTPADAETWLSAVLDKVRAL